MSAAGENFAVSEYCKEDFTLQNERRRRKFCGFSVLQRRFWLQNLRREDFTRKNRRGKSKIVAEKFSTLSRKKLFSTWQVDFFWNPNSKIFDFKSKKKAWLLPFLSEV